MSSSDQPPVCIPRRGASQLELTLDNTLKEQAVWERRYGPAFTQWLVDDLRKYELHQKKGVSMSK